MNIIEKIEQDLHTAMREKDATKVRALRLAMASIKYVEKENRKPLDDLGMMAVLQKEIKIRHETMEEAQKGGRQDLVDECTTDIQILEKYLPAPLSEAELEELVKNIIEETGADSMKDMGKVMPLAVQQVNGRAPNNLISQVIRKFLAG
ncbi:MAG: GatB/YqeY domain-containing protein [Chloroflexi bacterium]|nr:GatB/YqeY domain-containing protein [Chloroflexota bacterium]